MMQAKRQIITSDNQFRDDAMMEVAQARSELGAVLVALRRYDEAEPLLRESLESRQKTSTAGQRCAVVLLVSSDLVSSI